MKVGTTYRYVLTPSGKPMKNVDPIEIEPAKLMSDRYIEMVNNQTDTHGKFIKVDKAETKARFAKGKARQKEMKKQDELEKAIAFSKIEAVANVGLKQAAAEATKVEPEESKSVTKTETKSK